MIHQILAFTVIATYFVAWWFAGHILTNRWHQPVAHLIVILFGLGVPIVIIDALATRSYRGWDGTILTIWSLVPIGVIVKHIFWPADSPPAGTKLQVNWE